MPDTITAISWTWGTLGLVWVIGLIGTRRTVQAQPTGSRLFHMALAFFGFALLGTHWFERGWLGMRFVASLEPIRITGLILTIAGCAFAIWARVILGSNWSGRVTVKAGHELIVKGPYALARHPIYTGMLLAMAGTALAIGQWRCILGLFVFLPALAIKMSQEEHLMMRIFPKAYPPYRHRVKALIPGLF